MFRNTLALLALSSAFVSPVINAQELVIESWRNDNAIWEQKIIPAFNQHYPNITVTYRSPNNAADFNGQLQQKLANGTAGDLIACRPFDASLKLFQQGHLKEITEMAGMENFPSFAQAPWQTDSGAQTFCLPMASVIHGFFYNKDIFNTLNISEPETVADFYQVLRKTEQAGYLPLAIGTKDKWEAATMGFQNIGPTYWSGEDGRAALLDGTARMDSKPYRQTFTQLQKWADFMGEDFRARGYNDAIALFASGDAAIYPAGSWDILTFQDKMNLGVFRPPVNRKGDACYFSDHTDLGMGINANSKHPEAAQKFLQWMTTSEFAQLLTNELSGFFSLSNHFFDVENPIANTMMSWRNECDSTIRNSAQILSRGEPELELEIWEASVGVMNGTLSPQQAANRLQRGLETWYQPQQDSATNSPLQCDCALQTQ